MNLFIGVLLVIAGFVLNQWISHSASKNVLDRPMFLNYPSGILISTSLYIIIYLVGLYFLYRASIWLPFIFILLYLFLTISNLLKRK